MCNTSALNLKGGLRGELRGPAEGRAEGRAEGQAERQALSGGEAPLSPTPPAVRLECRLE